MMSETSGHDGEFVTVATFPEPMQASVAQSALDAAGITSYLRGAVANSMIPVAFEAELQVRIEDERDARQVLESADYTEGSLEAQTQDALGDTKTT